MDSPWRIELLGGLRAVLGDRLVTRFPTRQTAALLAYLAFFCDRGPIPRPELSELLWPESELEASRHRLRQALSSLRRQLEPPGVPPGGVIVADRFTVQLNPTAATTDIRQFEAALQAAARAGGTGRVQRLTEAVGLYRGELLPGQFEPWVLPERQRLAEAYLQALHSLIRHLEQAGDFHGAVQYARRAVAADPLREEGHHELIRLLDAVGQPEAALQQFRELERLLARELAALPAPEICSFIMELQRRTPGANVTNGEARGERPRAAGQEAPGGTHGLRLVAPFPGSAADPEPLPTGTVTFLLTDIETSPSRRDQTGCDAGIGQRCSADPPTAWVPAVGDAERKLGATLPESCIAPDQTSGADAAGPDGYFEALCRIHRRYGGSVINSMGESCLAAFARAGDALAAAVAGQRALSSGSGQGVEAAIWREERRDLTPPPQVRMALHTGDVELQAGQYHGRVLEEARQVVAAGHEGQILCSESTAILLRGHREEGIRLIDLGVYRLPAAATPERLFQVQYPDMVRQEFPPLRAAAGHAGNLPLQFTRFFGRETEIARLHDLLLTPDTGLVTLTGPGGTGKTRLALAVAEALRPAFDGAVWFVPLVDLTDPSLIEDQVLNALRVSRLPGVEPLEQVVAVLSRQAALLLMDNFEHLLPAGAALVVTLRERVPSLTCLITSRRHLDLPGEQVFPVAPLPVPAPRAPAPAPARDRARGKTEQEHDHEQEQDLPTSLFQCPSVRLFLDRAQAVRPDFQVTPANAAAVAGLCRRLEGLPLALELAAARAWVLTPAQMLARLPPGPGPSPGAPAPEASGRFELLVSRRREPDSRHQSLRAALDWSYQLLSPSLQRFFARLSVFRGGWNLEAAGAISDFGFPNSDWGTRASPSALRDAMDCLTQLQGCSLLVAEERGEEMRFRLLESLREYGAERLAPEERAELAQRHAGFFMALAERAEPEFWGREEVAWFDRIEREHDNLRAALDWSLATAGEESDPLSAARAEVGLRLAAALGRFWDARCYWREGWARMAALLAQAGPGISMAVRAKALLAASKLAWHQCEHERAVRLAEESLALFRELSDDSGIAHALQQLAWYSGDDQRAVMLCEESLPLFRQIEDQNGVADALCRLMCVAMNQGDLERAAKLGQESLAFYRATGYRAGIAFVLGWLAWLAGLQGDSRRRAALTEECLALFRELGDSNGVAIQLAALAHMAWSEREIDRAADLSAEGVRLFRELGIKPRLAYCLAILGDAARCQCRPDEARNHLQQGLALNQQLGDMIGIAWCLEGLAKLETAVSPPSPTALSSCPERGGEVGKKRLKDEPGCTRAVRLFAAAAALREAHHADPLAGRERVDYDHHLAVLGQVLGEAAFTTAWETGQLSSWEAAVAEALGAPPPQA